MKFQDPARFSVIRCSKRFSHESKSEKWEPTVIAESDHQMPKLAQIKEMIHTNLNWARVSRNVLQSQLVLHYNSSNTKLILKETPFQDHFAQGDNSSLVWFLNLINVTWKFKALQSCDTRNMGHTDQGAVLLWTKNLGIPPCSVLNSNVAWKLKACTVHHHYNKLCMVSLTADIVPVVIFHAMWIFLSGYQKHTWWWWGGRATKITTYGLNIKCLATMYLNPFWNQFLRYVHSCLQLVSMIKMIPTTLVQSQWFLNLLTN